MATTTAPETTTKVWTESDYRHFYGMLSYRDFLANLAAGTLDNYQTSRSQH